MTRLLDIAPSARGPRWATWITIVAIVAPLPYSLLRLLWALGVPVGISQDGLDAIGTPGIASLYVFGLAVGSECVGLLTHQFMYRGRRTVAGRPVSRGAVIVAGALVTAMLLAGAGLGDVGKLLSSPDEFRAAVDPDGWMGAGEFWAHQAVFVVWALAMAGATFAYYLRTRVRRRTPPARLSSAIASRTPSATRPGSGRAS